ncbi:MAG: hypothetical protein ACRBCI_00065 [Cellvibrionaceae bacterium]
MSLALPLNEEQRDCLQELTNVAMGAAAESLASLTNHFVCLPIPVIRCVDPSTLISSFDEIEIRSPTSVMTQDCSVGDLACRALVIVSDESMNSLADCSNRTLHTDTDNIQLMKDLFDTISDTCFDRLGEIFETNVIRKDMTIEGMHIAPDAFDLKTIIDAQQMVAVEIHYHIESHPFSCHLLLIFPEDAIETLAGNLDRLLD